MQIRKPIISKQRAIRQKAICIRWTNNGIKYFADTLTETLWAKKNLKLENAQVDGITHSNREKSYFLALPKYADY